MDDGGAGGGGGPGSLISCTAFSWANDFVVMSGGRSYRAKVACMCSRL